jgi:hypothetical protein
MLTPTLYFKDFLAYYAKAYELQVSNLVGSRVSVNDPLMDNVTIYDTVNRRYAGFSNMLEDLWYADKAPKGPKPQYKNLQMDWSEIVWFYVFLVHRITGSGASFQKDHGYRNSILPELAKFDTRRLMMRHILAYDKPMFTSIGNQIPPFNKPSLPYYKTGGKEYLCEIAPQVVDKLLGILTNKNKPITIQKGVDLVCKIQKSLGWKQFHFVLTAFIMDLAEYFPKYVDPKSHCYYGKNAKECMDLLFTEKRQYDQKMELLCGELEARPYDLEDVCCDYIRYVENYVPRGYEHLTLEQVTNRSLIKNHPKHQSYVSKLIKELI